MNRTVRGLFVLIGLVVFVAAFCLWIPFILLPGAGIGVALPVIFVPGEVLVRDFLGGGFHLTNTLVGMALADLVIVLILVALYLRGGIRAIPGRLQGVLELLVGFMYDFAKSVAGSRAGRVFPLVMTIFFFLLVSNWLELVPGVDSVGLLHCAEPGFNGYPVNVEEGEPIAGVVTLRNETPFDAGTKATLADFCACELEHVGHIPEAHAAECAELGFTAGHQEAGGHEADAAPQEEAEGAEAGEAVAAGAQAAEEGPAGDTEVMVAEAMVAEANPDLFVVTPFVRAAATDLNLTVAFALVAVVMIQVYGVWALGPSYFQKFFNLRALGNLGQKPLGLIDFVVGLFEIVSEFAKIISFAFRLFGNIFAGQVLLFIMAFLLAIFVPAVFYALELFVGLMQAFVFAVLTLIFSAQAMAAHHGDGHDEQH